MEMKEEVPRKKFGDEDGILFSVPPEISSVKILLK
jgi:hypothetical protein